jgi:hypothetical protein
MATTNTNLGRYQAQLRAETFTTGNVFFVDSNSTLGVDDTAHGDSPQRPFATLDFGIGQCTADNGDVIYLMPNHAETVTGVGGITADVAGVSIIGLGNFNQRPRFLMDGAATVTFLVTAADVLIENVVFAAGHADIARCINFSGAGLKLRFVEFVQNVVNENFLIPVDQVSSVLDNSGDGLHITNCRSIGIDAANTEFLCIVADIDGLVLRDNLVVQSGSTDGALVKTVTGKDLTNCFIVWNYVQNAMTAGDLLIDNDTTANTGIVAHNRCRHKDVTTTHSLIDLDGVGLFDNLSTSLDTASGFILPVIDTNA